jgi:hypothetical protein
MLFLRFYQQQMLRRTTKYEVLNRGLTAKIKHKFSFLVTLKSLRIKIKTSQKVRFV